MKISKFTRGKLYYHVYPLQTQKLKRKARRPAPARPRLTATTKQGHMASATFAVMTHYISGRPKKATPRANKKIWLPVKSCCARGRPIIVEWERDARHSAGLSLVRSYVTLKTANSGLSFSAGVDFVTFHSDYRHDSVQTMLKGRYRKKGPPSELSKCP
ncbi:hypothetical protein EVAR_11140_1 [Eumeta japonica]|uniref:Uncharacterized protein n=1 Tax=Eumeta variegata TaxID=151549 RepID=A0A4C1U488_EUMVA|nr:hypothetical protein EVAR_11140_1 [Eumeta japonica]